MPNWRLQTPVDAIVFDCDGTLSRIEGIDELATQNGVGAKVKELTAHAMGETGLNESLYQQRLQLVQPTRAQVLALAQHYFEQRVVGIERLIQLFQQLGKSVYIVSAGLYPAVAGLGELLQVPAAHIFAVEIEFDAQGNYVDFNHTSPLANNQGKREIVAAIRQKHPAIAYVGDGMNDLAVMPLVARFVGYGGAFYYEKVAEQCDFYIKSPSMMPLVPLILTAGEKEKLVGDGLELYEQGELGIDEGHVQML
ncbi:MAG: HAD-IB family phosphatase [Pseudomonadota bacterium]